MGTVREKFSRNRSSSRFINFIYGYKEPFAMEPLFNTLDIFDFHNYHLNFNDTIYERISQGFDNGWGVVEGVVMRQSTGISKRSLRGTAGDSSPVIQTAS